MSGSDDQERRAVEAWFRRRGLPLVVGRRSGTALLERTTPALVFLLLIDPLLSGLGVLLAVDDEEFARRSANPGYVIALLTLTVGALVLPVLAGWLLAKAMRRMAGRARRVLAGAVVALVVFVLPLVENWSGLRAGVLTHVLLNLVAVPVLLFLVYLGAGSIVSWALRNAVYQLGTVGSLASRALPLLMLVVLFSFFATEVWQVAAALPRWRLWLVVAFLAALAVLFLVAVLSEELRTMVRTLRAGPTADLVAHVTGTPFADLIDEDRERGRHPLTRPEKVNIALVLFLAQALQIVVFAALVFALFMVFGTLAVEPSVVESWVGREPPRGQLFGIRLPVTDALVQVSLFLAVFSGLYFAASAATDPHYRRSFFEPLLADVRVSLAAREVYLTRWPNAGQPPY
jgi:MFS family permease